jgi:hypothetical protein
MHQGNEDSRVQKISFQAMARLGSKIREVDSRKVSNGDNSRDKLRPFPASVWQVQHHAATLTDMGWTREVQEHFISENVDACANIDAGATVNLKCVSSPLHQLSLAEFSAASQSAITTGKDVLTKALYHLQEAKEQEDHVRRNVWLAMCGELQKHTSRHPSD